MGCWYLPQMEDPPPHILDAFSLELTQLFQTGAIWQRLVVAEGSFFLVDLGQGAAVGGMRLEISTGYSCYLIYNNFWHRMALQSNTEFNSYYLFSVILVFVFVFLHVFVIVFVFSIFICLPKYFLKLPQEAAQHSLWLLENKSLRV